MSTKTEDKIPKSYYYSVEGVLNEDGDLRKFSIPSFGRDLADEFDLEGVGNTTALAFYLDNEEYRDDSKWPLTFKFYKTLKATPVELEMNLSHSPCFLSTPRKIVQEKPAIVPKPRRTRKPKEDASDEEPVQTQSEQQDVENTPENDG